MTGHPHIIQNLGIKLINLHLEIRQQNLPIKDKKLTTITFIDILIHKDNNILQKKNAGTPHRQTYNY